MAHENLDPWANQGQTAQTQNAGRYSSMVNDPAAEYEKLMSGYKPSAGFQFKDENYRKMIEGAAAASGNRGGLGDQAAQAQLHQSLMQEDENNYYDKIYNLLGLGLTGNEGIAGRGFNATSDLTNILGTNNSEMGGLAYKGKENQNKTKADMMKLFAQMAMAAAGAPMGGGGGFESFFGGGGGGSNDLATAMYGKNLPGVGG
jgi:hypothetical protein